MNFLTNQAELLSYYPCVVREMNRKLTLLGETIIYIAAEFIEPQYAGGQLERLHLKDLVARSYVGRKVLPGSLLNDQEVSDADNGEGNTGASKKETSDASNDKGKSLL